MVDAGPLDERPVPRRGRVVDGEHQTLPAGDQRLEEFLHQPGCDTIGPFAGGRDGGVAGAELLSQAGGPDATGHGAPPAGQGRPKKEARQSWCRARVEYGCPGGKPVAESACGVRGYPGRVRSGWWSCGKAILPDGPALVYLLPINRSL